MKLTHTFFIVTACAALLACSRPATERPRAEYDKKTGRLTRLQFDANKNGRNDATAVMDGARIVRVELDLTENGKVDRWDFYKEDRSLEKVGFSKADDGVLDAVAFYDRASQLARMEISTARDGRFNRVEYYTAGVLIRSEEDTNGDGRADKWETYVPQPNHAAGEPAYAIATAAFDDTGRGKPQRRFTYGPKGTIALFEVDPDGDGTFAAVGTASAVHPPFTGQ